MDAAEGTIVAAPFDAKNLELTGAALPVAEGVLRDQYGSQFWDISTSGRLVYRTGTGTANQMTRWQSLGVVEDASMTDGEVVTGTTTDVFTNKSYDVEGTGNVFTFVEELDLSLGVCLAPGGEEPNWSTAGGAAGATPTCQVGTNTIFMTLDYSAGSTREAQRLLHLPQDFTGTMDVHLTWFSASTTGSVVWQVATICVADGETGDPAFNTASTVTDAAQGTTLQFNEAEIIGLTITGCAADELMFIQLLRDPADGSDDLGDTASLVSFELTTRRPI